MATTKFQVVGKNNSALFSMKVYRGEGMVLLAMNWKMGQPPKDFVGFAIDYKEPRGQRFFPIPNRIAFIGASGAVNPNKMSSYLSPIQKFRWVHFPYNAQLAGEFTYRVTPVFMNNSDVLSYGDAQEVAISLFHETYPDQLNVTFTRGFVLSQAFAEKYQDIPTLIPGEAKDGINFVPTHPKAKEALTWMGFEARARILDVLDRAIADPNAQVRVVAYELNIPELVARFEQLGNRLKIIIDDSEKQGEVGSSENEAERRLVLSAGRANVKRQHMGQLQHNKTIIVDSPDLKYAVCGSTNFSWRGFYVQANNAVLIQGETAVKTFKEAFDNYWNNSNVSGFGSTNSAIWNDLKLNGIKAKATFSPHTSANKMLDSIAEDINKNTKSSLFYSLAFLYQTKGSIRDAITAVTEKKDVFVYGISDKKVGGLDLQKPSGNHATVFPAALSGKLPEPFKQEPKGGGGNRMHHKFVVIDFDKPTARVYFGSYNFSGVADSQNGENLLLIQDRKIAIAYMIEAIRIFDHYHFRVALQEAKDEKKPLILKKPPRNAGEEAWWEEYYTDAVRIRDRALFG
jgi:phosphatidylserine/phosphatidylglycerophosphate/cardiolipin synthase-like enzyme